jgi:hypothetical protein
MISKVIATPVDDSQAGLLADADFTAEYGGYFEDGVYYPEEDEDISYGDCDLF